MWKRVECHNHTTESDGSITALELLEIMEREQVDGVALTDHNTISGHRKLRQLLEKRRAADPEYVLQVIYGMEYTTYYGHILCLNLSEYVPWENIDRHHPELLFEAAKQAGALVGIAHPFTYGHPFARGCRFDMQITDFSAVDYIEVVNNAQPMHPVNEQGIAWWEQLVLSGKHLAMSAGMDLHQDRPMADCFATYIQGEPGGSLAEELAAAVRSCQTHVSRGALLLTQVDQERRQLILQVKEVDKPGYSRKAEEAYVATLTTGRRTITVDLAQGVAQLPLDALQGEPVVIAKLYAGKVESSSLVAIAPAICLEMFYKKTTNKV